MGSVKRGVCKAKSSGPQTTAHLAWVLELENDNLQRINWVGSGLKAWECAGVQ